MEKELYEDEEFQDMAMGAMMDLGIPEDEAEVLLEDYLAGY